MKKITLNILVFIIVNCQLSIIICNAQPNGGFENWSPEFAFENPDDWQTFNVLSLLSPPNPLSAFKATGVDKHSGNYAIKIKSIFVNNKPVPSTIPDTLGCVFKGKIGLAPVSLIPGYPYAGRPERLEFYSKYSPVGNDSGLAAVYLRKFSGTAYDTIAKGELTLSASSNYSLFQMSLTYSSLELPDSAIIVFYSSKDSTTARVGSTLYIDDVAFAGWVGVDERKANDEKVLVFPNPAKDNLTITTEINEAENITIIDISGKTTGLYKIQNKKTNINTSLFPEGIYFYEIRDKKNKMLAKSKFSVVK